jgi:hypothetical protein
MNDRQIILEHFRQQSLQARAQAFSEQERNRQSLIPIQILGIFKYVK